MITVTRNQAVYVNWIGIATTAQIRVNILLELKPGKVVRYERIFTLTAARTQQINLISLTSGKIISISITDEAFNLEWGDVHVTFGIAGDTLASTGRLTNTLVQLGTGFISRTNSVSYPTGSNYPALYQHGRVTIDTPANPTAGTELSFTLPSGNRRLFQTLNFNLITDANAATRSIDLLITDGTNIIFRSLNNSTQVASTTKSYIGTQEIQILSSALNTIYIPIPKILLPENAVFSTTTNNIQVGDQFTDFVLLFEEFLIR